MEKKYEFTGEITKAWNRELHRIRALRDLGDVKAGQLGGFVEDESNLSHEGLCWVGDNACVYAGGKVYGNALVWDEAWVCGNAQVYDDATVEGSAKIVSGSWVYGNAVVRGNAVVSGGSCIFGGAVIDGAAAIDCGAEICSRASIKTRNDYTVICPVGSGKVTFFRNEDGNILAYQHDAMLRLKDYRILGCEEADAAGYAAKRMRGGRA